MIGMALLGVTLLVAGAALWVCLDAARFQRRNHCGVLLFPNYGSALAFHIGQKVGAPMVKLLLVAGIGALFVSVMAGPV